MKNPPALNVVIGTLLISIVLSIVSVARQSFAVFSYISLLVTLPLVAGLILRKEWARVLTFIAAGVFLFATITLTVMQLRYPTKAMFLYFGQAAFCVWILATFWGKRMRTAFNGGVEPPPASTKKIVLTAGIPVLLICATLAGGAYYLFRKVSKSLTQEIPAGNVVPLNRVENQKIGRALLEGKHHSSVKEILFVVHPAENNPNSSRNGFVNEFLELSQMPQTVLPKDEGLRLLADMAARAKRYHVMLETESREKQKQTGGKWWEFAKTYPDYKEWESFLGCRYPEKVKLDGSLFVKMTNNKIGRIYLKNCGEDSLVSYRAERDEPVPAIEPIAGKIEWPELFSIALQKVAIPGPALLYPELSIEQANEKVRAEFGPAYDTAVQFISGSSVLREEIGTIRTIQPAVGKNVATHWLDPSTTMTFAVTGIKGQAKVEVDVAYSTIRGQAFTDQKVIVLEAPAREAEAQMKDYIGKSILIAMNLGVPTSVEPEGICGSFASRCWFKVTGAKGSGLVTVDLNNENLQGKLDINGVVIPLEAMSAYQDYPPTSEMNFERPLAAYVVVNRMTYSYKDQANLKEVAFGHSVKAEVKNISTETQSFFVETRNAHVHWTGTTERLKTQLWPYIGDKGIVRIDLKPGEIYSTNLAFLLGPGEKSNRMQGSISLAPLNFQLIFTPLYTRTINGKEETVKNLGSFTTPAFPIIVTD